jgi:DnaJ-class molecular chaperone
MNFKQWLKESKDTYQPSNINQAKNILGLKEDSTIEDLEKAYREMAKRTHPDYGGNIVDFKKVKAAYDFLKQMQGYNQRTQSQTQNQEKQPQDWEEYILNSIEQEFNKKGIGIWNRKKILDMISKSKSIAGDLSGWENYFISKYQGKHSSEIKQAIENIKRKYQNKSFVGV